MAKKCHIVNPCKNLFLFIETDGLWLKLKSNKIHFNYLNYLEEKIVFSKLIFILIWHDLFHNTHFYIFISTLSICPIYIFLHRKKILLIDKEAFYKFNSIFILHYLKYNRNPN